MCVLVFCLCVVFFADVKAEEGIVDEKPVIIVDAGHGGKDPGAVERKYRIAEKEVVLAISRELVGSLEKKVGAQVYLTRTKDEYLTLERRNRLGNWRKCDLFLSIHANAAAHPKAEGIELYTLNKSSDRAAEKLAARENRVFPTKKQEDVDFLVSDLIQTAAAEESAFLAHQIARYLNQGFVKKYKTPPVRVKTALFYVLVGAKCPSVLVETGFVTNAREAKRLKSRSYQKNMAERIAEGIKEYFLERTKVNL